MNSNDRENVNFIMNLSDDEFESWASELSLEDIQAAINAIKQSRIELMDYEDSIMNATAEESNFAEARDVLKKFML